MVSSLPSSGCQDHSTPATLPGMDGLCCRKGPIGPDSILAFAQGECVGLFDTFPPDGGLGATGQRLPPPLSCRTDLSPAEFADMFPLSMGDETVLLAISLFSSSAYEHDISATMTVAMLHHRLITPDTISRLRTALHEAIANALIHGNLELASPARDDISDFVAFGEAINNRIADPHYAHRRLSVIVCRPADSAEGLRIHVHNEGPGFDPGALPPRERRSTARAHGGWALILAGCDHAAFSPDGRTLTLSLATGTLQAPCTSGAT